MSLRRWAMSRLCRTQVLMLLGLGVLAFIHLHGRYSEEHAWEFAAYEQENEEEDYYTEDKDSILVSNTLQVRFKPRKYPVTFEVYSPLDVLAELKGLNLSFELPPAPRELRRYPACHALCVGNKAAAEEELRGEGLCGAAYPYVFVGDNANPAAGELRAESSVPCIVRTGPSEIPNAGIGAFASVDLQPGTVFGPYEGAVIQGHFEEEALRYAWHLGGAEEDSVYVDARDPATSNWLRFVNTARYMEEQNIYGMSDGDHIWYIVFRPIPRGTELLTWYGSHYSETLGFHIAEDAHIEPGIAPRKALISCPDCLDSDWLNA